MCDDFDMIFGMTLVNTIKWMNCLHTTANLSIESSEEEKTKKTKIKTGAGLLF